MKRSWIVVAMVAWAWTPAHADETKAHELFSKGNEAFKEGRYSDALASYRRSFELHERPRTLFNIATCEDRLGNYESAIVAYERFIDIAEERDAKLKGKAAARSAELRGWVKVALSVFSAPPGAGIYVDGAKQLVGRTPYTVELSLGPHEVRLELSGHEPITTTVTMEPGQQAKIDAELVPFARLTITVEPADAEIQLVGDEAVTGRFSRPMQPGVYELEIRRPGYVSQTLKVEVAGTTPVSRHVSLQRVVTDDAPADKVAAGDRGSGRRTAGLIVAGAGVVGIGVGVWFGVDAGSTWDEATDSGHCEVDGDGQLLCDMEGIDLVDDAKSAALIADVSYGIGAAALITGAVLWWTAPSGDARDEPRALRITPGPGTTGIGIAGSF